MPSKITERLSQLDPTLRAKLETHLLTEIEKSVASSALSASQGGQAGGQGTFDRQHDRGPLFGKDFDRQGHSIDEMREIATLDEDQFQRFANRLSTLRGGGP